VLVTIGLTEVEIATPPGADDPHTSWRDAVRPRWRVIARTGGVALVAAVVLLVALPRPHPGAVKRIDPSSVIARAQRLGAFPVYVPSPLPPGWVPSSAHLDSTIGKAHLHIGYQSPDFGYVGLEETDAPVRSPIVSQVTAGGVPQNAYLIGGLFWQQAESTRRPLYSISWYGPKSEVIVAGTASIANLKALVASLRLS
jgi:hypothetical protein